MTCKIQFRIVVYYNIKAQGTFNLHQMPFLIEFIYCTCVLYWIICSIRNSVNITAITKWVQLCQKLWATFKRSIASMLYHVFNQIFLIFDVHLIPQLHLPYEELTDALCLCDTKTSEWKVWYLPSRRFAFLTPSGCLACAYTPSGFVSILSTFHPAVLALCGQNMWPCQ